MSRNRTVAVVVLLAVVMFFAIPAPTAASPELIVGVALVAVPVIVAGVVTFFRFLTKDQTVELKPAQEPDRPQPVAEGEAVHAIDPARVAEN